MAFIQFLRSTISDQSELRMTYVTWLPYKELTPSNSICSTTPTDALHLYVMLIHVGEKA